MRNNLVWISFRIPGKCSYRDKDKMVSVKTSWMQESRSSVFYKTPWCPRLWRKRKQTSEVASAKITIKGVNYRQALARRPRTHQLSIHIDKFRGCRRGSGGFAHLANQINVISVECQRMGELNEKSISPRWSAPCIFTSIWTGVLLSVAEEQISCVWIKELTAG